MQRSVALLGLAPDGVKCWPPSGAPRGGGHQHGRPHFAADGARRWSPIAGSPGLPLPTAWPTGSRPAGYTSVGMRRPCIPALALKASKTPTLSPSATGPGSWTATTPPPRGHGHGASHPPANGLMRGHGLGAALLRRFGGAVLPQVFPLVARRLAAATLGLDHDV